MLILEVVSEDMLDSIIKTVTNDNNHDERMAGYDQSGSFALALIDILVANGVQAWPRGLMGGDGEFDYGEDGDPWARDDFDLADAMHTDDKAELVITENGSVNAWLVGVPGFKGTDSGYGYEGLMDDYDEIVMTYSKNDDCAGIHDFTREQMIAMFTKYDYSQEWYTHFKSILSAPVTRWLNSLKRRPPGDPGQV